MQKHYAADDFVKDEDNLVYRMVIVTFSCNVCLSVLHQIDAKVGEIACQLHLSELVECFIWVPESLCLVQFIAE